MSDEAPSEPDALVLVVTPRGLELREANAPESRGVRARIDKHAAGPRVSRRHAFGRAIGPGARTVLDATAGLGQDAGMLVAMGFDVTAVERVPMLAALLRDAVERLPEIASRLRVVEDDARDVLREAAPPPDVVYLDPMFPPKRKTSALARKSVRWIRRLAGDDPDAADLLAVAREHAAQRVVVKRPTYATPVASEPSFVIETKLVRYDVYV